MTGDYVEKIGRLYLAIGAPAHEAAMERADEIAHVRAERDALSVRARELEEASAVLRAERDYARGRADAAEEQLRAALRQLAERTRNPN